MREAFFGLSTDWKEGINWANVRDWRLKRAHAEMEKAGLGALLLFYDENMARGDLFGVTCLVDTHAGMEPTEARPQVRDPAGRPSTDRLRAG